MLGSVLVGLFFAAARVSVPSWLDGLAARIADRALAIYQVCLSRLTGRACLFATSCSSFARLAIRRDGWNAGAPAAAARLRCCGTPAAVIRTAQGRVRIRGRDGTLFTPDQLSPAYRAICSAGPVGDEAETPG